MLLSLLLGFGHLGKLAAEPGAGLGQIVLFLRPVQFLQVGSQSELRCHSFCNQALGMHELPAERLHAIATESEKATEPAFPEVARRLSVALVACTVMDLDRVAGQVLTPSKFVLEAKGLPSIAEASAIVVAGRNARLLGARVATERATCAIATGEG